MSGSLFWYDYQNDASTNFAVLVDKSNAIATIGTAPLMIVRTTNNPQAPRGLKFRYANAFLQSNPLIKRRFPIGNRTAFTAAAAPGATITSGTDVWVVSSLRGEKFRNVPPFGASDTGQTT